MIEPERAQSASFSRMRQASPERGRLVYAAVTLYAGGIRQVSPPAAGR
jgi:hypothetical protein